MRILVVGAGGALGRQLAATLVAAGHEVRPLGGGPEELPLDAAGFRPFLEGIEGIAAIGSRLGRRPGSDRETALAAPFSAGFDERRAGDVLRDAAEAAIGPLADAAVEAGIRRFLLVTSTEVYGRPAALPCREGDWKRPRTETARRLWELERRAFARFADRGLPVVFLRPALVYGPGVGGAISSLLGLLALGARRGRRVTVLRRGPVLHLVHLEDVAAAAAHLLAHRYEEEVAGRAFHVADETPLPLEEVARAALRALELPAPRRVPYLPRLLSALAAAIRILPPQLGANLLYGALDDDWARLARRHGLAREQRPRFGDAGLRALAADHHYDTSRLAGLGFTLRHPVATEGLAAHVRWCLAERRLPVFGAPALPARATLALPEESSSG